MMLLVTLIQMFRSSWTNGRTLPPWNIMYPLKGISDEHGGAHFCNTSCWGGLRQEDGEFGSVYATQ